MAHNKVKDKKLGCNVTNAKGSIWKSWEDLLLVINAYAALFIKLKCMWAYFIIKHSLKIAWALAEAFHKYAGKRKTLSGLITILKLWAIRFDEKYY